MTTSPEGATITNPESNQQRLAEQPLARKQLPGGAMVWVLVALIIVAVIVSKGVFIRPTNLSTVLFQSAVIGVLAIAQAFAVICRGLDLSVGATAIFSALVVGGASSTEDSFVPHMPLPLAILAGLLLGLAIGSVNGFLAGRTPVPAFIITLSTFLIVVGLTFMATGAAPVTSPNSLIKDFGDARIWVVPAPVLAWVLFIGIGYLLLNKTKYGRMLYAVGGNETAARLSGVRVPRVKLLVYATAGVFASVAGMLFLARTGTVLPSDGGSFMLDSIAAVAVGGVSLNGGKGRIREVVLGVLILAIAGNLMNIMGVSQYLQTAVQGAIILVAVAVNLRLAQGREDV
jgi:ribose/xylose/arabinose/galactoside ABC-type transport system permease subunit